MKMPAIAAFALALCYYAGAAEEAAPAKPVPSAAQAESEGAPVGSPVQTNGKVVSMHSVTLANVSDPHMVVKLENEQGDTDIVDLGPTSELKANNIEPKAGQVFWVDGRVGKINDKFLIVAERLSESKLITIARTAPLREETQKHADARTENNGGSSVSQVSGAKDPAAPKTLTVDAGQQVRTVEGVILKTRHVNIEGDANEHVFAKIQTEQGTAVVDLGTCKAMPATVNLTEGQLLAATGFVGQVNGRPIILADSVGNLSTIQRPMDAPGSAPSK